MCQVAGAADVVEADGAGDVLVGGGVVVVGDGEVEVGEGDGVGDLLLVGVGDVGVTTGW